MESETSGPFAVLRVNARKAKTMAAIAAASEHHIQTEASPNFDPQGEPPIVMHLAAGNTPYQAARHLLRGAERRNRETVLCRDIVLSASASYFRPGRPDQAGEFDSGAMQIWAKAALKWAQTQWPDQLASVTLHLAESVPHLHLLVVPRTKTVLGGWKLNSKALFDRERLRELQTSYAAALADLGIKRGLPGSEATHTEVRQFYGAIRSAVAGALPHRPKPPITPAKPSAPTRSLPKLLEAVASMFGVTTAYGRQMTAYRLQVARWRRADREAREEEAKAWEQLRALAVVAPIESRRRQAKPQATPQQQPLIRPKYRM